MNKYQFMDLALSQAAIARLGDDSVGAAILVAVYFEVCQL